MIKVYFGPYCHSPAPALPPDECYLWFPEFHYLKGFDRNFWTSNPMHLDVFDPSQIMVWQSDKWVALTAAADALMPHRHQDDDLKDLCPGRLALACELLYAFERFKAITEDPPEQQ
jgi:hypothetical protein